MRSSGAEIPGSERGPGPVGRGAGWCRLLAAVACLVASCSSPALWAADVPSPDVPSPDPVGAGAAAPGGAASLELPAGQEAGGAPSGDEPSGLVALARSIDEAAGHVVEGLKAVLFFDPVRFLLGAERAKDYPEVRLIVVWLLFGAVAFTLIMGFINLRGFRHSLSLVRGDFTDPRSHGEVSHFQALCAALSATVGLGNIAGVALAVNLGGPGAVFWMVVAGFFGMTSKFVECALGQKYREIDDRGRVSGGAMHYLRKGLAELGLAPLGAVLSVLFALLCIGGSFGGGNMYQANQSWDALSSALSRTGLVADGPLREYGSWIYGTVLVVLVGLVIIGGIRRIATTAGRIVPFMCGVYVAGSAYIILANLGAAGEALSTIVGEAFTSESVRGGFVGVLLIGVQRAAFSNEAGVGSASIAHSAARTAVPVREGFVALLEPFIDTIVVCTMTGLVVVITGAYAQPEFVGATEGSAITVAAWQTVADWFPLVLAAATVLFAFSTLISWSYYGERCWTYLFGPRSTLAYKLLFLAFIYVGSVIRLGNVMDFSDMMILGMAFPNLLGCLLLSPGLRRDLRDYWRRFRGGEFRRYR